jgi:hypothetical protein
MGHIRIDIDGELAEGLSAFDVASAVNQLAKRLCSELRHVHFQHDGTGDAIGAGSQVRWGYWPERLEPEASGN